MVSLGSLRELSLRATLIELVHTRVWEKRPSAVFSACAFTIVASLVLGGGTKGGFLSDAILELIAIPGFLISLWVLIEIRSSKTAITRGTYWVLTFCFAIVLVPLIQLIPLPPWIWTRLPGRNHVEAVFDVLNGVRPWMPISVSPNATWLCLLSLLPPMAIFIGAIQLSLRERRRLSLIIIAVGVVGAFLGLIQVAQGPASALRFFTITNTTEAVGFFANRNHFASLMYTLLMFTSVWTLHFAFKIRSWTELKSIEPFIIAALIACFMVIIVLLAGEAVARSRAGLVLTIAALAGIFVLALTDRRSASGAGTAKLLIGATMLAVIFIVQFALYRILNRFAVDTLADARLVFARNTIRAAMAFMPFGSGLGTFVPVYAMFERPGDIIANIYANHAHDDFLELWLETGVMGVALLGVFVAWAATRSFMIWRKPPATLSELDCSMARAGTIVIALLLMHSLVDYPLRTEAIMAVFAFSCALLIEPLSVAATAVSVAREPSRERAPPQELKRPADIAPASDVSPQPRPVAGPAANQPQAPAPLPQTGGRWGDDLEWPEEWRK